MPPIGLATQIYPMLLLLWDLNFEPQKDSLSIFEIDIMCVYLYFKYIINIMYIYIYIYIWLKDGE